MVFNMINNYYQKSVHLPFLSQSPNLVGSGPFIINPNSSLSLSFYYKFFSAIFYYSNFYLSSYKGFSFSFKKPFGSNSFSISFFEIFYPNDSAIVGFIGYLMLLQNLK